MKMDAPLMRVVGHTHQAPPHQVADLLSNGICLVRPNDIQTPIVGSVVPANHPHEGTQWVGVNVTTIQCLVPAPSTSPGTGGATNYHHYVIKDMNAHITFGRFASIVAPFVHASLCESFDAARFTSALPGTRWISDAREESPHRCFAMQLEQ